MNVMYISVTERTEEIAIRRAFCQRSRYRNTILSRECGPCIGGIIGLILGIIININ